MSKFLDSTGVSTLWGKVKNLVKTSVSDKLDVANGIPTLDGEGKLKTSQLPSFKTVNGTSVVGSGDITIDLSLYKVVESLPAIAQAETNKIYLVLSSASGEQDLYTEYAAINNAWEKLGEYKAAIDLEPYQKKETLADDIAKAGFVKFTDTASSVKAGVIKTGYETSEKNYKVDVDTNGNAFVNVPWQNTTYNPADASNNGLMTSTQFNKLEAIAAEATKDEAITVQELEEILV